MMGGIIILLLFVFIAFCVPVVFSLGFAGLSYFLVKGISLETFAQRIVVGVDSFALLAAPFFILAGNIMNTGGVTRRIFRFANSLVGHLRGGLGHVNVLGSMFFAGMSGTAIADAAGLGAIEIKAMTEQGYDTEFSAAVTASSAIIGPIIPPSTVMVIYGVTAGVSISQLFMGGILPGIMIGILLMLMVAYYARKNNYPKSNRFSLKELALSFLDTVWALITPVIIIGGVLGGICTPTEAGAISAAYALFISLFVYRELKLKDVPKILFDSMITSGVILLIVSTASVFGWCLTYERLPQKVAAALSTMINSKALLLAVLVVIYLFLGMIMETSAIVITTVPIFVPVLKGMGVDLVYFGVILALLMSIGTITPPVGTVLFIIAKITKIPIERLTKVMLPWYGILLAAVVLLILFPRIILFIPGLMAK
ncbi:MAG: TRAP transporter large permease [Treponema sp.]|jgi:tripartite ATP-independent transporter DctM subunit|nr:TRAP transporter large permease [Treponema sp.]